MFNNILVKNMNVPLLKQTNSPHNFTIFLDFMMVNLLFVRIRHVNKVAQGFIGCADKSLMFFVSNPHTQHGFACPLAIWSNFAQHFVDYNLPDIVCQ